MKFIIKRAGSDSGRTHPFLRWSGDVFLAIGVLILGYCCYVLIDTKLYQTYQIHRFQQEMKDLKPAVAGSDGFQGMSFHPPVAGAVGQIEIARIGVDAMIMEGTADRTLRRAVGHIPGTPLPGQQGNVGIAGHRDTFFRALRNVRQDDEITLMTLSGSYRYRVASTQVVEPDDVRVLDHSDGEILTLVTCYPFYFVGPAPKRFIVHADRILR